jgi:hypothetical protein
VNDTSLINLESTTDVVTRKFRELKF